MMAPRSWWAVLFGRPRRGERFRARAISFCVAFGVVLLLDALWHPRKGPLIWVGAVFFAASLLQETLWVRQRRQAQWTRGSDVRH
jgi:predicted anti-sigma-YlaC factor YlaD